MLAGVVAADGWRDTATGVGYCQTVSITIPNYYTVGCGPGRGGVATKSCRRRQNHRVKVYPQLADVVVCLTEGVGAGVAVGADRVGGHDGV